MGSSSLSEKSQALEVVDAPLESLRPHPRNPRTITPARLAQLQRTLEAERDMLQARPVVALPDGPVIAGKPVECSTRALTNHTGDVYDPFAGTGSALIAAEMYGRACYAMEIEPAYCDVIRDRYAAFVDGP